MVSELEKVEMQGQQDHDSQDGDVSLMVIILNDLKQLGQGQPTGIMRASKMMVADHITSNSSNPCWKSAAVVVPPRWRVANFQLVLIGMMYPSRMIAVAVNKLKPQMKSWTHPEMTCMSPPSSAACKESQVGFASSQITHCSKPACTI